MLRRLSVENYALIDKLEMELGPHLNIITGETGAGKIEFAHVFEKSFHALMTLDFSSFGKDVWPVLKPMIAGCVPYYVLVWFVSYYLVKKALDKVSEHRRKNRVRL